MSALADTWRLRTTPRRGVDSFPWRGVRLLYRGSETPWGVRDSAGIRTSTGGPEPPAVRAERLLLPEHVVLPDLSQPGDGSGPLSGEQGFRTAGVRLLDVVKDNYKAPFA